MNAVAGGDSEAGEASIAPRPYLSLEQLTQLTPWTRDGVEKMIRRGVLEKGVHFFQPTGHRGRLLFKWAAIVSLIEGRKISESSPRVLGDQGRDTVSRNEGDSRAEILDVEKATTELQRMLS